jgi:predicted RecB family nuclease
MTRILARPQPITDELFEAFLRCRYKSKLRIAGADRQSSELAAHRKKLQDAYRDDARQRLLGSVCDTADAVRSGVGCGHIGHRRTLLSELALATDGLSATVDVLQRTEPASGPGSFSYMPVHYCRQHRVGRVAKLILAFRSIVFGRAKGDLPTHGIIVHGPGFAEQKIQLGALQGKTERLLEGLRAQVEGAIDTPLILNQHCPICEFRTICKAEATATDNLSLLGGMTEQQIKAQNQKGIFTVNQLSYTFRHRKPPKRAKRHANPHHYSLQALSLRTNTVHIHGTPVLPVADIEVYFDIEGLPDDGFEYLVGAAVAQNGRVECHAFWASNRAEQATAFARFVDLVAGLPGCKLFHFGRYDTDALRRVREDLDLDRRERIDRILADSINVLAVIHAHVYFPVYSNSLKEVASFLGYQWSHADASGMLSIMWREMWELSHDPSLQERLICYNREDCLALKQVCDFVRSAVIRATSSELPDPIRPGGPTVAATKDILRRTRKWVEYKRPTFALDEFAHASNSAYFDYQRERVFARTDKKVARICKNRRRSKSARVNQQIVLAGDQCGRCGSAEIRAGRRVRRRVLDLRFTTSGVKRWVVEYVSSRYYCRECERNFLPDAWPKYRGLYGDSLAAWCVYQNIACRQTMWQVIDALHEVFGINLPRGKAYAFKKRIVSAYDGLYDEIHMHLLKNRVLYVDEGDVAIRKSKGYVWVFATTDAVLYLYRDTRAAEFLPAFLNGFSGVLVSDFYSAYDSVDCPQQKCLLHLLRDFNNDLQNNPYDPEFKSIAQPFGCVLRSIVETIDRYGLARRHLHKHQKPADRFLRNVCNGTFASELALKYQKRLAKCGEKLFTFLKYDGVSWNNNSAENAVKHFMRYKRTSDGLFSERSIKEALVILSVLQTCKLNGINFLGFLLSKATGLDTILEGAGRRRSRGYARGS